MLSLPVALSEIGAVSFFSMDDAVYVGCSLRGSLPADEIAVPDGDSFWARDFAEGDDFYLVYRRNN